MFKVGPRKWIVRIAITWGALSALMMFVQGERRMAVDVLDRGILTPNPSS
jgi:hypothetical protein